MRARNIKPGFFTDAELLELPPLTRILFEGLWCVADRDGRLEDKPKDLKIMILPCDVCNMDEMLESLTPHFISRYAGNGSKYIQIVNFNKHQNPHINETSRNIPTCTMQAPCKHGATRDDSLNDDSLNDDSQEKHICSSSDTMSDKVPGAKAPKKPKKKSAHIPSPQFDDDFTEWWNRYPRKVGKQPSRLLYDKIREQEIPAEYLMDAVDAYNREISVNGTQPGFVKHPQTFLGPNGYFNDYAEMKGWREVES